MRVGFIVLAILLSSASGVGFGAATGPGCGEGPVTATSGGGVPELPSLQFAALKTGTRAVVTWTTPDAHAASLRYHVNGGPVSVRSEASARNVHLFVLDPVPLHATLCFVPLDASGAALAPMQGLHLANAMNAHDGTAYTINLLALANEQADVLRIEEAFDGFAETLRDMTDGHVQAGRVITIFGDLENANVGWTSCVIVPVRSGISPICHYFYDVIWTTDASPQGAASTYKDAITVRDRAIWMNSYHQGGSPVSLGDDTGVVLTHEMGHYAFGAMDLYAENGVGADCWDPAKGLSVMGGSRSASELDDEIHRCPNEANIADYVPTWTLLRERFPLVPLRTTIDEGPHGPGSAYVRTSLHVTPPIREAVPDIPNLAEFDPQDDAETGDDAGNHLVSATPIETGHLYRGTLLVPLDGADVYVFEAPAGSVVEARAYPRTACFELLRANGASVGGSCALAPDSASRTTIAEGGPMYIRFLTTSGPAYAFGVGVDAPAPGLTG